MTISKLTEELVETEAKVKGSEEAKKLSNFVTENLGVSKRLEEMLKNSDARLEDLSGRYSKLVYRWKEATALNA